MIIMLQGVIYKWRKLVFVVATRQLSSIITLVRYPKGQVYGAADTVGGVGTFYRNRSHRDILLGVGPKLKHFPGSGVEGGTVKKNFPGSKDL